MRKRKTNTSDPRLATPPGHFLKNAPWRRDFVIEEHATHKVSARESVVLVFLVISSVAVAAALWMNPPQILHLKSEQAIKGQATLAGNRIPRPYNGHSYDTDKFEELKEDDPMIQDDLEDLLHEEIKSEAPKQTL